MSNIQTVENDTTSSETNAVPTAPDGGGWGWIVVLSSFVIHVVADGVKYSFSIFYEEFLKEFKDSKAKTSMVSSVMFSAYLLIGPVAGWLIEKYGCRATAILGSVCSTFGLAMSAMATNITFLIFAAGLCTGIGFGLMYVSAIVCVTVYFEERRAFATGIATSGSGIGSCAMAPFIHWMVDLMGWRSAMLIVAGIVLNCSVFGSFFRPLDRGEGRRRKSTTNSKKDLLQASLRRLPRNKAFVTYALSNFILIFVIYVPSIYFVDFVSELHIANTDEISYLLATVGISNSIGTIIIGYISNLPSVNKFWVYIIGNSLCGLATALWCLFTSYPLMAIYATVYGITSGVVPSLSPVIIVDIVGLELITTALGVSLVLEGISCLVGPSVIGLMYDYSGSYCSGFLMSGSTIILSSLMILFIPCHFKKRGSN